jgi:hypothetical protein
MIGATSLADDSFGREKPARCFAGLLAVGFF